LSLPIFKTLKEKAGLLKTQTFTLLLAAGHKKTPWYAKAFMILVVGYALSPIDLIPDFIPVLGYLDDLIIIPVGIYLALKMIPKDVYRECRAKAESEAINTKAKWIGLGIILFVWLIVITIVVKSVWG
jgi:uncharacterized membrane protein YkvA (DUF1232 family)